MQSSAKTAGGMPPVDRGGTEQGRGSGQLSNAAIEGNVPSRAILPRSTADSCGQMSPVARGSQAQRQEQGLEQPSNEASGPTLALRVRTQQQSTVENSKQIQPATADGGWGGRQQGQSLGTPDGRSSTSGGLTEQRTRHETRAQIAPVHSRDRGPEQRPVRSPDAARRGSLLSRGQTLQATLASDEETRPTPQNVRSLRPHTHPLPSRVPITAVITPMANSRHSSTATRGQELEAVATPRLPARNSPSPPRNENLSSEARALPCERIIRIGIEAEFMVTGRDRCDTGSTLEEFAKILATKYNRRVHPRHPRMRPILREYLEHGDYKRWCLVEDPTVSFNHKPPWGIELVSPILEVFPNSNWRRDVEAIWSHLHEFYHVNETSDCGTHVHISLDPFYSLPELKRIAQAVIHFETALEVLVPQERRGNYFAMSNWLNSDQLARMGRSRPDSIAYIDKQTTHRQVIAAMGTFHDKDYCWHFTGLLDHDRSTLEFRKPPASTTAEQALTWAEFAICFIQASIKCGSSARLQQVPPTVRGLRWFLGAGQVSGVNEPDRLEMLWTGKDPDAALEPIFVDPEESRQGVGSVLQSMKQADMKRVLTLASSAGEPPYW